MVTPASLRSKVGSRCKEVKQSGSFGPEYSISLYVLVAVIWLVPDRRIEKVLNE